MAMTYEQSNALTQDFTFKGRVKISCLKYADSILGEAPTTPAHNSRYRWATNCEQQPDQTASVVVNPVVMDAAVQNAGVDENGKALITDEALQGSVEAVVNKLL